MCSPVTRLSQRSRQVDASQYENVIKEVEREEDGLSAEEKLKEADKRFRAKRLEASMTSSATEQRVESLKEAMRHFLKRNQGNLKRAFSLADVDHSGQLDFAEFRDAVRNFGLKHLSAGALKTLFDNFDEDGDGAISHSEFAQSILRKGQSDEIVRRTGPMIEPPRIGFEATPSTLELGELCVNGVYETSLSILNAGDTDLRLGVKLDSRAARDNYKNPVRVVGRHSGPLAPGLRARLAFEICVRAPGTLDLDVLVTCGSQQVVVPMRAKLVRRDPTLSKPSKSTSHEKCVLVQKNAKRATRATLPEVQTRRAATARVRRVAVGRSCRRESVWPSLSEQWEEVQLQKSEAVNLLSKLPELAECPFTHVDGLAARLKRVSFRPGSNMYETHVTPKRIIFVGSGSAELVDISQSEARHSSSKARRQDSGSRKNNRQRARLLSLENDISDDEDQQKAAMETVSLRAPFHVGAWSLLSLPHEQQQLYRVASDSTSRRATPSTLCEGFCLSANEAAGLIETKNLALAMIRRKLLQQRHETECAEHGGLIRCNYRDASFVDALLNYARAETRHEAKANFLCRQLLLTDQCLSELNLLDDILSGADKTEDQIRTDRTLAFDRCLVASDKIWTDFVGDESRQTGRVAKKSRNGENPHILSSGTLLTDDRIQQMLASRHRALAESNFDLLYKIYTPLEQDVSAILDRTLLHAFVQTPQYAAWLDAKFPLETIFESPSRLPRRNFSGSG